MQNELPWKVKYQRANGTEFFSEPYANKHSAEMIAAIGRVTAQLVGIVAIDVVPA